ncbi:CBO0543 family protein [Neobacillus drentensis]|uniref:CBO0543 family protein n=1 Tax=Neobacillus drentensis TaxID=220684 RepID=UPI003B58A84B
MIPKLTLYFPWILSVMLLISALIFAIWKNLKIYYPTIIFAISVDFYISIITYEHSLWYFHKAFLVPNHTIADLFIAFTNLPLIILVYLSRYPYKAPFYKQLVYISFWSILFTFIETIFLFLKLLSYHNGWNFWWSMVVWFFIFFGITLHNKKPLLAWLLCFSCTLFLIFYLQIPILKMK